MTGAKPEFKVQNTIKARAQLSCFAEALVSVILIDLAP